MKKEKGQSLIEVLVGLAAAVLIVGAITVATISALNNATYSKNQNLATEYAQQGAEIVRNLRDRNYTLFSALNGTYCLAKTCTQIDPTSNNPQDPCGPKSLVCDQNVGGQNADIYVRQVAIDRAATHCQENTQQATQAVEATVTVSWYDGKCRSSSVFCHSVAVSTCLSTFNTIPPQ